MEWGYADLIYRCSDGSSVLVRMKRNSWRYIDRVELADGQAIDYDDFAGAECFDGANHSNPNRDLVDYRPTPEQLRLIWGWPNEDPRGPSPLRGTYGA